MSLNFHKRPTVLSSSEPEKNPMAKRQKLKWRLVFVAICFTKALVSLPRKALDGSKQTLRSLSYVAIDVAGLDSVHDHDNGNPSFPNFDELKKLLTAMLREKSFESLRHLGGVKQVVALLKTDEKNGIQGNEAQLLQRKDAFGANNSKNPPVKSFLSFVREALRDSGIVVLLGYALLSLVVDSKQHGWKQGWYEGLGIIFALFFRITVSAVSDFAQNRQFEKLSNETGSTKVDVMRNGRRQAVWIFEVVVGDVVLLSIGDQIPADGLFLNGHSLKVKEPSMTGESHVEIKDECPFFLSGSKVTDGYGSMLVTSVGMNTVRGEMMSSVSSDLKEQTPLQESLDNLNSCVRKVGLVASFVVLLVLVFRYFPGSNEYDRSKATFYDITIAVFRTNAAFATIVVVSSLEVLPLAITLILAYSTKHMVADNVLVRENSAFETMGEATTICTDKTGTLTLNQMKVTEFWLGASMNTFASNIAHNVHELLQEAIALNTTGTAYMSNSESSPEIHGSPTEKALLSWGLLDLGMDLDNPKQNCRILNVEPFDPEKKRSGVLMKRIRERAIHTHWKGAAEMILAICSHSYDRSGTMKVMDDKERTEIGKIIKDMATKSLRCIAFAHREVAEVDGRIYKKLEESGLTLVGIVGLMDPCRPGVRTAVESCKKSGVNVKMITGDNAYTARAIAIECGILSLNEDLNNDAVIESVQFRSYSDEERKRRIEKTSVIARASPCDKRLLVNCLKERGDVVVVIGNGTNDAPGLKEADVVLSLSIQGTEVAKESSDIVILDDNFSSVVTVLRWGRCVYYNIQKLTQVQLTVNVAALVINFTAAVSSGDLPLSAVLLLYVNLIIDTLGAIALATGRPTDQLMAKPPVGRSGRLITKVMWRNLLAQVLYQATVLLTLKFEGRSIFHVDEKVKKTLILNIFVLCLIFNLFNARDMEKKNIFKGLRKIKLFLGIVGMILILQMVVVEFLYRIASSKRLNWAQWGACVGLAALSWLIGWIAKLIPAEVFLLFEAWIPCIKWNTS